MAILTTAIRRGFALYECILVLLVVLVVLPVLIIVLVFVLFSLSSFKISCVFLVASHHGRYTR